MTDANWHVLTVSHKGLVSLLKGLTEDLARRTVQRLSPRYGSPEPWSDAAIAETVEAVAHIRSQPDTASVWTASLGEGRVYQLGDSDLVRIEAFGPDGVDLEVWPKPADYDARLAAALAAAGIEPLPADS